MQREEATRQVVQGLLTQQQLGVLSTAGEKGPYASLVAFTASADLRHLYFVTPRTTRKFANLTANAAVALLVNDSLNNPEDFHRAAAVTAVGSAKAVGPSGLAPIREQYLARHPYLEAFAHSPSCEFVDIRVERYILVERFQNVSEYLLAERP
jgi:hypothetical protein